jgi:general secretion pathway protein A
MYASFFGLREMPFNVTPDPRFLYLSPSHQEALQHLRFGIREKKGFIVLTGEVGCGKTTLCRQLLHEMEGQAVTTALILNPRLSETQLLQAILTELGVAPLRRTRKELQEQLNAHLLERNAAGFDVVLIIDESQNLSFDALEHVRLLSNLETDTQKLLQIILIGQPELRARLQQEKLRQLRQRVLVYFDLQPLSRPHLSAYIAHRLAVAGSEGRPQFTRAAEGAIFRRTRGIPRLINNLCDKALLAAFVRESHTVSWWDVRRAVREMSPS